MAILGSTNWIEQAKQAGASSADLKDLAAEVDLTIGLRMRQNPDVGLDDDLNIIIGITGGSVSVKFADNDRADAPVIVAMDYDVGKGILMGKQDMTQAYMGGKVKIAKGNLMDLAKYSGQLPKITGALSDIMGETQWPDELSADMLPTFKQELSQTMAMGEIPI